MKSNEFISKTKVNEIDRRGFLKGAGSALGAAALGSISKPAQAAYRLSDEDDHIITVASFYIYYSLVPGSSTKGPGAAIRSVLKDISGFMGEDIENIRINAAISVLNKLYQEDRNKWQTFQSQLNTVDGGINLANKLERIKDKIIYSMSAEERKYHMNRLGIKEDKSVKE